MTPHYEDATVTLHHGDCLDVLRELPDASVDAVVTDPPYGLEFMGKEWDRFKAPADAWDTDTERNYHSEGRTAEKWQIARPRFTAGHPFQQWCALWTAECLRVLKPGGHLLAFGGTRTWHRLACAVEDAGFEVRDSIAWLYGSGFPKSLDVSKAIDKAAGATREVKPWIGKEVAGDSVFSDRTSTATSGNLQCPDCLKWKFAPDYCKCPKDNGAQTADAERWQGWGTALKPAFEPIVVARKPLAGTVAANVLTHGTGALNIDGCRVEGAVPQVTQGAEDRIYGNGKGLRSEPMLSKPHAAGRWPANVVLDESQAAALDAQSGELHTQDPHVDKTMPINNDTGGASRFFYTAKAPGTERIKLNGTAHPTVKPLALMRWLVRLVTPPGGTVLEPFAGSGTTVEACILEGFSCIAIEREADYLPLIVQRIHRRRDPVQAVKAAGEDGGLFDLLGGPAA
jgi:DNA modification methylase